MTQDEIIEMARQAGFKMENSAAIQAAEIFHKLATAKEREACAVACEKEQEYWGWSIVFDSAKLIRARAGDKND
jgi:hypothetical protein